MSGLRIRLHIGGRLKSEEWVVDPAEALLVAERHVAATSEADELYMIEIFDPDASPDQAYMRFGTDSAGMVQPVEVGEL